MKRALLSVSDRTGLEEFARFLTDLGVELVATSGTHAALTAAGIPALTVEQVTGFPEILGGRVRTLHPAIHAGILARRDQDLDVLAAHGIAPIDLVAVSLYPFQRALAEGGSVNHCIDQIDIGGVALIRAAAKNQDWVTVVTDPSDYRMVMGDMKQGATSQALRRLLAARAFARTAAYDSLIADWLDGGHVSFSGTLRERLRYGENPHQQAALYRDGSDRPGVATARQLSGPPLGYNNLIDADAAFEMVCEFDRPAAAIVKHANPCGVATGADPATAFRRALDADPQSAYGGVIAFNRELDDRAAEALAGLFLDVAIAPSVSTTARIRLEAKEKLRVVVTGALVDPAMAGQGVRSVGGGFLVQTRDTGQVKPDQLRAVTRRLPGEAEIADMMFAYRVAKHVKSNAIVLARDSCTVGIGAGQMSRVDAVEVAAMKAADISRAAGRDRGAKGAVMASDGFLPFADGLIAAAEAGVTAVIQPGGSKRDRDVIAAADEHGIAMVFTQLRHFRH